MGQSHIFIYRYSEPTGPIFYYEPPTNKSFGAGPHGVLDPYEKKWCKVGESTIGAGEGVFMKRDAPGNRTVNLYSGLMFDHPEDVILYHLWCRENTSLSDEERR